MNMSQILNMIPEGIIILDKDLEKVKFTNKQAFKMIVGSSDNESFSSSANKDKINESESQEHQKREDFVYDKICQMNVKKIDMAPSANQKR